MLPSLIRWTSALALRRWPAWVACAAVCAQASAWVGPPWFLPPSAHVLGGTSIQVGGLSQTNLERVFFGETEALDVVLDWENCPPDNDKGFGCEYGYRCTVPPRAEAGTVDMVLLFRGGGVLVAEGAFTYLAAPEITSVSPSQNSILPDDDEEPVTIKGRGFTGEQGVQVYFGGRPAIEVLSAGKGTITCLPPPFPGGPHPLPVEVRVVNADGSEGAALGMYRYERIIPEILFVSSETLPAWRVGPGIYFLLEKLVDGDTLGVFFNGVAGTENQIISTQGTEYLYSRSPAMPPGEAILTIVNGDGGAYTLQGVVTYTGTPSTDFHAGDLDQNFRFSLSEVLRVVQLFNSEGYHCDASGEDGYAPGPGEQSCAPYPADTAPQDWQLGLEELLQIIQFYNLHCYQPCPAAPGTYCPPNPPQF